VFCDLGNKLHREHETGHQQVCFARFEDGSQKKKKKKKCNVICLTAQADALSIIRNGNKRCVVLNLSAFMNLSSNLNSKLYSHMLNGQRVYITTVLYETWELKHN
jgi:hypothetical protein